MKEATHYQAVANPVVAPLLQWQKAPVLRQHGDGLGLLELYHDDVGRDGRWLMVNDVMPERSKVAPHRLFGNDDLFGRDHR